MMTHRECFKAIINGEDADRIPAVLRLDPWYNYCVHENNLPDEVKGMSLPEVQNHLGFGCSARKGQVFKKTYTNNIDFVQSQEGDKLITQWHTSKGSLRCIRIDDPEIAKAGLAPAIREYPVKSEKDFAIYEEIMLNTIYTECYDDYRRYDAEIGKNGYPLLVLHAIPFHDLLLKWTGYEAGFLFHVDQPDMFLHAVEIANKTYQVMWDIVAESPAQLIMHGVNFDTSMTCPPLFRDHFLPYIKSFNNKMHAKGKKVVFHGDGDMQGLLDLVIEAEYDVADCFACHPMVDCTFAAASDAWKNDIVIWGGIPSTLMEERVPMDEFDKHLDGIFKCVKTNKKFIFGIADQAMPTASWDKIKFLAEKIRNQSMA